MKNNFFYTICLITLSLAGQNKYINFKGEVLDKTSNLPISDVIITQNNSLLGFTDSEGEFNLKIDTSLSDYLTIKHFSYKQISYKVNSISKSKHSIVLSPLVNILDEVLIGYDNAAESIISKARKKFKDVYRKSPYWASSNLKQVIRLNDSLPAYLEGYYNLFMVGDDKDVWNLPIFIPLKIRRTKEKFIEAFGNKRRNKQPKFYNNLGINCLSESLLTSYRFFEFAHPLLRKGKKNYSFTLEDTIIVTGLEHYIISYKSLRESNNIKGRKFYDMRGEMVLEKETLIIKSITSLHRRSTYGNDKGVDNIFTIHYKSINNSIYPKTIAYNIKNKASNSSLEVEGILSLNKIYDEPVENYRRTISSNRYLFHSSDIYNNYNENFWSEKTDKPNFLELKNFGGKIKDESFVEGVNQTIKPKDLYPGSKENESKLLKLMPKSIK